VLKDAVEEPEGSAVHVLAADDVVPGAEHLHDRVDARGAAGEGETMAPPLERGDVSLERLARGILAACVLVPLVFAQCVLYVRGREVHGRHDCAGEGLGPLARVNSSGAERRPEIVIVDASHARRWLNVIGLR
jgi:hypothetical protein